MNEKMIALIRKYALWLTVTYGIQFALARVIYQFNYGFGLDNSKNIVWLLQVSIFVMHTLLNMITAFVIKRDKDKFEIYTQYVYLATVLFRSLGVFAFLLYAFYSEQRAKQSPAEVN
jgi:hypothetical protein